MSKFVYSFNEGSKEMRDRLGGKGANLAEMTQMGLPVPFGFTITTEVCNRYYAENFEIDEGILNQIFEKLTEIEDITGKKYGIAANPLLLSVRSGAAISMPGMMDTVLNVGMNGEIAQGLADITGDEVFAYDTYRTFLRMYGSTVMGVDMASFDELDLQILENFEIKDSKRVDFLKIAVEEYKAHIFEFTGREVPEDVDLQLKECIKAVFESWHNERSRLYRQVNKIDDKIGTGVTVQSMVFGNLGNKSGTGVAFSRNPIDGRDEIFGEFLINEQGEAVVSGKFIPVDISQLLDISKELFNTFKKIAKLLETHFNDVQDIEFTVENGKIFILQSKNAKRSPKGAVKIAVDMEAEGIINKRDGLMRIKGSQISKFLQPIFAEKDIQEHEPVFRGNPGSPGAAVGRLCLSVENAISMVRQGEKVILAVPSAKAENLKGLLISEGMISVTGGKTAHNVVLAREMGIPYISGVKNLELDEASGLMRFGKESFKEGEILSIDGTGGNVYRGELHRQEVALTEDLATVLKWSDEFKSLKVRANIRSYEEAELAASYGAEGIGLCRTENIFEPTYINDMSCILLSDSEADQKLALERLILVQKNIIKKIYILFRDKPVTIRLIDPLLSKWLPGTEEETEKLADRLGCDLRKMKAKLREMTEDTPMLGYRGSRISVKYPDIAVMQAKAIAMACKETEEETGYKVSPEILLPLVSISKEFSYVKSIISDTLDEFISANGYKFNYTIGTMIEVPRAALVAGEIAKDAEFFSFGTNDLTQLTFGASKDIEKNIMSAYIEAGIMDSNPLETIDTAGVGKLISMAVELGRGSRPNIKLGICGDQSSDPETIKFCSKLGFNYISCDPGKIPSARIVAAQASIHLGLK